eukprot:1606186-Pleurochrysis_carterae.AAC.2
MSRPHPPTTETAREKSMHYAAPCSTHAHARVPVRGRARLCAGPHAGRAHGGGALFRPHGHHARLHHLLRRRHQRAAPTTGDAHARIPRRPPTQTSRTDPTCMQTSCPN